MIPIYIPTAGRASVKEQKLLGLLPIQLRHYTQLVVQPKQLADYAPLAKQARVDLLPLPQWASYDIGRTQQFILDQEDGKFAMFDDDLLIFKRRTDDPTKFTRVTGDQFVDLLVTMEQELETYAHTGVLAREGGNRVLARRLYASRMTAAVAYRAKTLRKLGIRFDRLKLKQDFDVTLSLLRKGYCNSVICDYVRGQYNAGCSNAPGGCSVYRTDDMNAKTSEQLAKLHPGFVKVVRKTTKVSWGGGERVDVQIAWKKAFLSSGGEL